MGLKLPCHFIEAGIGAPDGTDVSGHLLPMRVGAQMLAAVYRTVLPLALKYGVTTEQRGVSFFEEIQKSESDSPSDSPYFTLAAAGERLEAETGLTNGTFLQQPFELLCPPLGQKHRFR